MGLQMIHRKTAEIKKYAISLTRSVFHRTSTPITGEKGMFLSGTICWYIIAQENLMLKTREFDANCTEARLKLIKWPANRRFFASPSCQFRCYFFWIRFIYIYIILKLLYIISFFISLLSFLLSKGFTLLFRFSKCILLLPLFSYILSLF